MVEGICSQTIDNFREKSQNKKIVLWGAIESNVKKANSLFNNIDCIIDTDSEHWGLRCDFLKIYSQEHLYALNPDTHVILVTSRSANVFSITKAIKEVDNFDIFYLSVITDKFFGFFSKELYNNYERIQNVEKMLYDDRSRKVYREVVRRRIIGATGEFNNLKTRTDPQYIFRHMYTIIDDEVIIDCGGYIGDSVEKFVLAFGNSVKKIYSFECFQDNIAKIKEKGEELTENGWTGKLIVVPYAVSDKNGRITFNDIGNPEGGSLPDSRLTVQYNEKLAPINIVEVETKTIDDYLPENEKVTLIKMDIEGAEYEALKGAEKTIKKYQPRLAISIYHNPDDYWRICEVIHSFNSEYQFAVRHHQNNHLDTVLYAWIEEGKEC